MNENYYIHANVLFKRACAFILDIFICFFIGVFFMTIYTVLTALIIDKPNLNTLLLILLGTNYLLLLFKDFIRGNSLGKKTFKIVILDEQTSFVPTKKQLLLRNLFLFLSPVEMILPIFTGKRVGDYVSKTVVVDKRNIDKIRSD